MSDGYERPDAEPRHRGWRINGSLSSSSSHTASSRPPSESTFDEDDLDSLVAIPPSEPAWHTKHHIMVGNPTPVPDSVKALGPWRGKESKLKTAHAALILCLNIGVDPPDVVKTNPCAVLECWIDPFSLPPSKALESIGKNLVHQFDTLNPRMKYRHYPDPSVDDTKKHCMQLRKLVKDERALFYYNGHGVPKPTSSGEIWVFNRGYTQYIPVSLHDLQAWLGSPTIYVWDCSAAGHILDNFEKFAKKRDQEYYQQHPDPAAQASYAPFMESIHLAACAADENLPMAPELPADVFTSSLTSPIEMALRFHILQNQSRLKVTIEDAMKIPGDLKDRRTPLGELNWIFTAVTDTIAWTTFPNVLFKRLFRQDWTLAALFRNFLLAERIMRKYNCTPRAFPPLPPAHTHPLWMSWDLAVDKVMVQLPKLLENPAPVAMAPTDAPPWKYETVASVFFEEHLQAFFIWLNKGGRLMARYQSGPQQQQFPDNLPAITLPTLAPDEIVHQQPDDVIATTTGRRKPSARRSRETRDAPRKPPDQLPILLQVLLSQQHRLRALILLGSFVDLGSWAVHLALVIGIFPYVQKLLQSPAAELRPILIFIWSRIIAFDPTVQIDLLKDGGHNYFTNLLKPDVVLSLPNEAEHKAMAMFIIAMECRDHQLGQQSCFQTGVISSIIAGMEHPDMLQKEWSTLALAVLWDGFDEVKSYAVELLRVHELLESMLFDDSVQVRAAVIYTLSTLYGATSSAGLEKRGGGGTGSMLHLTERNHLGFEMKLGLTAVMAAKNDLSPMVRKEILVFISTLVSEWRGWFVVAAWAYWEGSRSLFKDLTNSGRPKRGRTASDAGRRGLNESNADIVWMGIETWVERTTDEEDVKVHNHVVMTTVFILYSTLLEMSVDPYPEVANRARILADYIMALLKDSPFAKLPESTLHAVPSSDIPAGSAAGFRPRSPVQTKSIASSSSPASKDASRRTSLAISEGALSTTIKRTSSIASSIRNLAAGYAFPSLADKENHPALVEGDDDHHILSTSPKKVQADPHPPRFEYRAAIPESRYPMVHYIPPYADASGMTGDSAPPSLRSGVRSSAASLRSFRSSVTSQGQVPSASAPNTPRHRGGFQLTSSSGRDTPSSGPSTSPESSTFVPFHPADVIEALIEEDWERLRVRRRAGLQAREQHVRMMQQQQQARLGGSQAPLQTLSNLAAQQQHRTPPPNGLPPQHPPRMDASWTSSSSSSFVTTDSDGSSSGLFPGALGTGVGLAGILPLKSTLFDAEREFFSEPQMRHEENDELGSVVANEMSWKEQRNTRILADTERQSKFANRCHWDKSLLTIQNNHPVRNLKFHQFETHLITSNNDRIVSVWDWAKKKRIACFDNGNPEGTSITSLHFLNDDKDTLILTASSDGMIRLFANYDPESSMDDWPLEMLSAFRGLPTLMVGDWRSGVVTDWLQQFGLLLVGGDSGVVKLWDAHKEMLASDIRTEADSCITSIASDLDGAQTVVAGTGDGQILIFDRRDSRSVLRTKAYANHRSWVQSVHWQRGCGREILSGSLDGQVILWDIRATHGTVEHWEPHATGLSNLAMHDQTGVFASTSGFYKTQARQQTIVVHSMPPLRTPVQTNLKIPFTTPPTLSHPFFPTPTSLAFHPHEMILGWGGYDGRIKIFGCNLNDPLRAPDPDADLPVNVQFGRPPASVATSRDS